MKVKGRGSREIWLPLLLCYYAKRQKALSANNAQLAERKYVARIALRRSGRVSFTRTAVGGEFYKQDSFLSHNLIKKAYRAGKRCILLCMPFKYKNICILSM